MKTLLSIFRLDSHDCTVASSPPPPPKKNNKQINNKKKKKRAWSYLQNFPCVLCQQSSFGLEELLYSMLTQQLNTGCERKERRVVH